MRIFPRSVTMWIEKRLLIGYDAEGGGFESNRANN